MKGSIQQRGNSFRVFYWQGPRRITKSFKSKHDAEIFKAGLVVMDAAKTLD